MPTSVSMLRSRQIRLLDRWLTALGRGRRPSKLVAAMRAIPGCTSLLVGYRRCFPTLEAAQRALGAYAGGGHSNPRNIDVHADLSDRPRESDYAAFYHLMSRTQHVHSVFDLGGNIGNLYYYYRHCLDWPDDLRWQVMDLEDVVVAGRRIAEQRQATALSFTTRFQDGDGCNLMIASGALHYLAEPLPDLIRRLERKLPCP